MNLASKNRRYKDLLNNADIVYADGLGIVWVSKILGKSLKEKLSLSDLFPYLCSLSEKKGYRLYFLGGKEKVIQDLAKYVKKSFPNLNFNYNNGYFNDNDKIIKKINKFKPDILLVGMGVPKQEYWIEENLNQINTKIAWGVGGLFDFYSGNVKRAPKWMINSGLEGFWRFLMEPCRLWRNLLNIPLFIISILRHIFIKDD
jgi:N-acetylglucosaminyldiphosphoundecaprenol N-acetyl-beta-D-mannosaminyltransferase